MVVEEECFSGANLTGGDTFPPDPITREKMILNKIVRTLRLVLGMGGVVCQIATVF